MNQTGYNMYIYKIWRIVFWRWQGGCPANTIKSCCQMSLGFEVGRIFLKNQSNLTDVETEGVHKLVNRLPSPTGSRWDSIDLFFYFINTTKSSKISLHYHTKPVCSLILDFMNLSDTFTVFRKQSIKTTKYNVTHISHSKSIEC